MSARDAWINYKTVNNLDETTRRHRGLLETKPTPGENQSHITQVRQSRDEIQQILWTITHDPDPLWVNEISAKSYSATLTELIRKADQFLSESSWGVSPSPQDLLVSTSTTEFKTLVTNTAEENAGRSSFRGWHALAAASSASRTKLTPVTSPNPKERLEVVQTKTPDVSHIRTLSTSHNPSKSTTLPQILVKAAEGDTSHVMQASTQEDEDTSHSHQHLKSDTVTQPATTKTEIVQPALTQSSHIIKSEEVIAVPQLNITTPDTKPNALPEKVMPETPQPPASSDISAMLQQLLGG
jgi:hypothetical protein